METQIFFGYESGVEKSISAHLLRLVGTIFQLFRCYGKIMIVWCFIDYVTPPALASIPSLKSRNHGAPAIPACFKVVELLAGHQLK